MKISGMPYVLLALAILFWSGNTVVGRAVRLDIPPVAFAFWRWFAAALIMLLVARPHLRKDWVVIKRHWPILVLLSAIGIAAFNALLYSGLQWTIAINSFLLQSMMPVFIVALSFLIFREKVTVPQILGVLICLAGAVVIIIRGDLAVLRALTLNRGDIYIFIAVICYAGYSVMLCKRPPIHQLSLMAVTFILGTLLLLPLYMGEILSGRVIAFNRTTVLAVGFVALFPSIISYFCFNRGIELVGANRGGMFLYLMPVFGSLLAIFFLGEVVRWFHLAGFGLIIPGLLLANRR